MNNQTRTFHVFSFTFKLQNFSDMSWNLLGNQKLCVFNCQQALGNFRGLTINTTFCSRSKVIIKTLVSKLFAVFDSSVFDSSDLTKLWINWISLQLLLFSLHGGSVSYIEIFTKSDLFLHNFMIAAILCNWS